MRARARLAALGLLFLLPAAALEPPRTLPCTIESSGGRLMVSVDLLDAFPADLQKQVSNGLMNVITVQVGLISERDGEVTALYARELDVLYDVWEETYGVTVKDASSPSGRRLVFDSFPALHAFLTRPRGVDLGPVESLREGGWVVQTRVELNPVSRELLDRTRELLAHPATAGRGGGPSRSVLGAMASYLLRGSDPAGEVHVFRSGPFSSAAVAPR